MNEIPVSSPAAESRDYKLSSDLAKLCLPAAFPDANRKLAYVNSICFLFLLIGLIGLKPPKIIQKPLLQPVVVVPVVFTLPDEPQIQPEQPQRPNEPQDTIVETPQVLTVVEADSAAVAFTVPVAVPVIVAQSPQFALPPLKQKGSRFALDAEAGGKFPQPTYPREELLARHQGDVMLYVIVDPNGLPSSVTVKGSSGYPTLDRHSAQWIKNNWHFLPGKVRHYLVPIVFQLR